MYIVSIIYDLYTSSLGDRELDVQSFFIGAGKYQEQIQPTNLIGKEEIEIKIIFHVLVNFLHPVFK